MAINRRDNDLQRVFTRRALLLGTAQLGMFGALVGRLYYLQVMESHKYHLLAEENRINMRLLSPRRGRVLDRFGVELASNRRNYRVMIVAEQTRNVDATLEALSRLIQVDDTQRARVKREIERRRKFVPVVVAENLSWDDFAKVNLHSPDLPGVQLDVGETRDYPYAHIFSHVVGYVGAVAENELGDDPLLELPGFRIGKSGVEKVYDERLRGRAGHSQIEVNAYGRAIRELERYNGQQGDDIVLTIDADLQRYAQERFGEDSGAAVVIDIHTGEILALVSNPGYDPNWFNVGITGAQWRQLSNDKYKPLINKAIAGQYPPGSTYKMLVGIAALESGNMTPETRVFCPGHMEFGNNTFHCWKKGGHGTMNFVSALEESCDVYFYEAAKRTGVDKIGEVAKKLGLGDFTGIDLTGERRGIIPTKAWKQGALGQPWHPGENLVIGIGQGYVTTTPLQLAVMAARLANGGYAVPPRIVRKEGFGPASDQRLASQRWPSLNLKREQLDLALEGMIRVTAPPRGTAAGARIMQAQYAMAGKTGSSQVRRISRLERETRVRKNEEKPWEERDHALFVAYAPISAPRYACAVIIEHGGSGAKAAAPVARDIMLECQKLDPSRKPRSAPGPTTASGTAPATTKAGAEMAYWSNRNDTSLSRKLRDVNWGLVLLITVIASLGFTALYSAAGGDIDPWADRQMARFAIGLVIMVVIAVTDIRIWMRLSYVIYAIGVILLIAVELVGRIGMGAQRWLDLGVVHIQPSEIMKIAMVLTLARYFHGLSYEDIGRIRWLVLPLAIVLVPVGLVIKQPDLGTAMLLLASSGAVFFFTGVRAWKFLLVIVGGGAALPIAWNFLHDYQKRRVLTFMNPEQDPLGSGYHILQSKIALGSGGFSGKGFMQGTQSHLSFLPEKQTDFIFTMFAEEHGLLGALVLIALYILLIAYGYAISLRSRSQYGRLLAGGLTTMLFLYVFINIAMVSGMVPVVGVPLPLFSYGGTAMMTLLVGIGLLVNVYVHRDVEIPRHMSGPLS